MVNVWPARYTAPSLLFSQPRKAYPAFAGSPGATVTMSASEYSEEGGTVPPSLPLPS